MKKLLTIVIYVFCTHKMGAPEYINNTQHDIWIKYHDNLITLAPKESFHADFFNVYSIDMLIKDAPFSEDNYETLCFDTTFRHHLSPSISSLSIQPTNESNHFASISYYPGRRVQKSKFKTSEHYKESIPDVWYIEKDNDKKDSYSLTLSIKAEKQ